MLLDPRTDRYEIKKAYDEFLINEAVSQKKKNQIYTELIKLLDVYKAEFKPRDLKNAQKMVDSVLGLEDELEVLDVIGNISNMVKEDSKIIKKLEKVVDLV